MIAINLTSFKNESFTVLVMSISNSASYKSAKVDTISMARKNDQRRIESQNIEINHNNLSPHLENTHSDDETSEIVFPAHIQ